MVISMGDILREIDVRDYFRDHSTSIWCRSIGIMLCIISVIGFMLVDAFYLWYDFIGLLFMVLCVTTGVILIVSSSSMAKRWKHLKKSNCIMDEDALQYAKDEKEDYHSIYQVTLTVGIVLCALSFMPMIILDELYLSYNIVDWDEIGVVIMFLFVGVGVMLIVRSASMNKMYDTLLRINARNQKKAAQEQTFTNEQMAWEQSQKQEQEPEREPEQYQTYDTTVEEHVSPFVSIAEKILPEYWKWVLILYLAISFITGDWGSTWIIWPLAPFFRKFLVKELSKAGK